MFCPGSHRGLAGEPLHAQHAQHAQHGGDPRFRRARRLRLRARDWLGVGRGAFASAPFGARLGDSEPVDERVLGSRCLAATRDVTGSEGRDEKTSGGPIVGVGVFRRRRRSWRTTTRRVMYFHLFSTADERQNRALHMPAGGLGRSRSLPPHWGPCLIGFAPITCPDGVFDHGMGRQVQGWREIV
jgi:hypothetical protein